MTGVEVAEIVEKVESSLSFTIFRKEHPKAKLVHLFSMHEPGKANFELGYCAGKKLFVFTTAPVRLLPSDEPFSKSSKLHKLDLANVSLSPHQAEMLALKQANATVTKVIFILQHLDKPVYNITLVTAAFTFLNIRIDPDSGAILAKEEKPLLSLRK